MAAATPGALVTPKRAAPRSDRNIDKVVLGNICFKAWYPSYYGKEVLGDISSNAVAAGSNDVTGPTTHKVGGDNGGGGGGGGGRKKEPPMLDRLYVCPCCFKYSKELVSWWGHVKCCESKAFVPGKKVYTHPRGTGTGVRKFGAGAAAAVAENPPAPGKGKGKKKADAAAPPAAESTEREEEEEEEGEWSVWEVDGEDERVSIRSG